MGAPRIDASRDLDATLPDPQSINLDLFPGSEYRDLPILNLQGVVGQIDSGARLNAGADGVITFAFSNFQQLPGINNNPHLGEGQGYSSFSATERDAARSAVTYWDDLIAPSFREVTPGPGTSSWARNEVDIWLANTTTGPAQAWAYYPGAGNQYQRLASDVWTADPTVNWTNDWFSNLGYGDTTLIHELGHSLGLSHPGAYNYDPSIELSYELAEYAQDSNQYTIMSYWDPSETGARIINWTGLLIAFAQTPMLHDIYTIQQVYGADPTTRTGDTVYGFGSNAGRAEFDFNLNPYPFVSVYDAGGSDRIDLSGFGISQFLDLHAGSFSSIGAGMPSEASVNAYLANLTALSGEDWGTFDAATWSGLQSQFRVANANSIASDLQLTGHAPVTGIFTSEYQNFSIAYGVTIENGTGGSARDLLWGNEVANELRGLGGNDVLNGFQGADTLYGGTGNDTFMFGHLETGDRIMDWNNGDRIDLRELDANGSASGVQAFTFIGGAAFSGTTPGQLRYAGGQLQGDVNGDGTADFVVSLLGSPAIGATDLVLA